MGKNIIIALTLFITACISCSKGPADGSAEINPQVMELIQTVPSDALAVICSDECGDALTLIDSTNILNKLELGELADSPAAIFFSYEGKLRANLSINAGKRATDSTLWVSSLLLQAKKLKMQSRFFPATEDSDAFLVITSSETQMNAVSRHLSEGRSILEADKFQEALGESEGSKEIVILRNRGASRLIPSNIPAEMFSRKEICSFIEDFAEWTLLLPQRDGSFKIRSIQGESHSYFANMIESLPGKRLKVETFIPDSSSFLMSMAVPSESFREAYELHKDASVELNSYRRKLNELKSATKKDPLKWEKEMATEEISVLSWKGEQILLIRSSDKTAGSELKENPYRGFAAALYGSAFGIKDDSYYSSQGEWHIFGSSNAVKAFSEACASRETKQKPSGPDCHFILKYGQYTLVWDKKEFTLWNSNL